MAEYLIQDTTLDAIADAINAKTGGSAAMTPADMVTAIATIPSGGDIGLELVSTEEINVVDDSMSTSSYTINTFFRDFALIPNAIQGHPYVFVIFLINNTSTENSAGIMAATVTVPATTKDEEFLNNGGGGGIRKNGSKTTGGASTFRIGSGSVIRRIILAP